MKTEPAFARPFLKAPVEFSRISSRFNKRRLHPVLNKVKAHLGTDYAAAKGTPIIAVGDGVVIKSSYTKGNGKYVKIRHNATYTTQYLHMSRRKVKEGQAVRQGDVIGYVGSTGLATGPHVCFRFWKNGQQVDHLQRRFPSVHPHSRRSYGGFCPKGGHVASRNGPDERSTDATTGVEPVSVRPLSFGGPVLDGRQQGQT